MADSTEGDTEVQYLGALVSALIALIAGLVIHSFIIGVNVNDWWKGRSVTPVDQIVTSLGISRMCAQCSNILHFFVSLVFIRNVDSFVSQDIMNLVYGFFIYANVWLTSLLSIVFCLKISNLQTRLFLYLSRMIVQRTDYSILASLLLSAFSGLMPFLITITEVNKGGAYNTTRDLFVDCSNPYYLCNYFIGPSIPLVFYYISSVLLFASLYHHTTRMKMSSNLTINLETYYSAMRLVSFTFIYNTIYFIGLFVCAFYYFFYCVYLSWLHIFLGFQPVLHSSYLIYRTAKLRNQMSKVLQNLIAFLFQRKDTETRENIEVAAK